MRACGAPSSPCFGASARSVSGDSTQPTASSWYAGSLILAPSIYYRVGLSGHISGFANVIPMTLYHKDT
jgi:hypothetical protein